MIKNIKVESQRPITLTVGMLENHNEIKFLTSKMVEPNRNRVYDLLRDYHYANVPSARDHQLTAPLVDFLISETNVDTEDMETISNMLTSVNKLSRDIDFAASRISKHIVNYNIQAYRVTHMDDHRRDEITVIVAL